MLPKLAPHCWSSSAKAVSVPPPPGLARRDFTPVNARGVENDRVPAQAGSNGLLNFKGVGSENVYSEMFHMACQ
jgi:hypothetical protein